MTLVELLAATCLSTLLMGGVLGVLTSLSRSQEAVLENHGFPPAWHQRLEEILAWDLENSRSIQGGGTQVTLIGFAGHDFSTGIPIHSPTIVRYEVIEVEDRRHLVRREIHPDSRSLENSISELICLDVAGIEISSSSAAPHATKAEAKTSFPEGPIPSLLQVSLLSSKSSNPLFSKTFSLR